MAGEFNPDPWLRVDGKYVDRTYASGVAQERPKLTTRIHCEPERESVMRTAALSGPAHERQLHDIEESRALRMMGDGEIEAETQAEWFTRELRSGHGFRNAGDE